VSSPSDFDHFREQRGVSVDDEEAVAALFAEWLAQETGWPIIGGPVDEPPSVVAIPEEP
jgi:hypothetical protein